MAGTSVQFAVATHIMTALGFHYGKEVTSGALAASVNTEASFVRKALSKLAKAGLVITTRGKDGHCSLSRPPEDITLKDIYIASEAPAPFAIHGYPVEKACPISSNIKGCMSVIQEQTQIGLQASLSAVTLASVVAQIRQRQNAQMKGDTIAS
jgi:DNA-binding IscR family transcriptional regulator